MSLSIGEGGGKILAISLGYGRRHGLSDANLSCHTVRWSSLPWKSLLRWALPLATPPDTPQHFGGAQLRHNIQDDHQCDTLHTQGNATATTSNMHDAAAKHGLENKIWTCHALLMSKAK